MDNSKKLSNVPIDAPPAPEERAIRIGELQRMLGGVSRGMIYQAELRDPSFPRRRNLGNRVSVWLLSEVIGYLRGLEPGILRRGPKPRRALDGTLMEAERARA